MPKRPNWPRKSSSSSSTISIGLPVSNQRPKLAIKQLLACHKQKHAQKNKCADRTSKKKKCMDASGLRSKPATQKLATEDLQHHIEMMVTATICKRETLRR
jgi:hypothetical protein